MAERILIVDDEADVRLLLRELFSQEGWIITEAQDAERALEAYTTETPDLIVLDNMMPGTTGIEFARALRKDGSTVPIVLFSGYLNPGLMSEAQELNLWPCSKVDLDALLRVIRNLLLTHSSEGKN